MSWKENAACVGMNADMDVEVLTNVQRVKWAKGICEPCPVKTDCLRAALVEEAGQACQYRHLVRGGKTPRERYDMERLGTNCVVCGVEGNGCCDTCKDQAKRFRHELTDSMFNLPRLGCLGCGVELSLYATNDLCQRCGKLAARRPFRPAYLYREAS